jgi:hypothetical protein
MLTHFLAMSGVGKIHPRCVMQTIQDGYRSFSLLVSINWDRLLYVAAIAASLFLGAYLGTLMIDAMTHPAAY